MTRQPFRDVRAVASEAVARFGFSGSEIAPLSHHENVTFSVRAPRTSERFLLRVHRPGYQSAPSIASELRWLQALSDDTGLVVPRPVGTNGAAVVAIEREDSPTPLLCSLLRWVDGRRVLRTQRPVHLRRLGRITAMLHEHAASWTPPSGFTRPVWDAAGLFGPRPNLLGSDASASLSPEHRPLLEKIAARFDGAVCELGRSREVFGLIHADLHLENVVFASGAARPIDFDDCGFGWFAYDLAATAQLFPPFPDAAERRASFLAGYREVRRVDDAQVRHLGVMRAARLAALALWLIARARADAGVRANIDAWIEQGRRQIESLLEERP